MSNKNEYVYSEAKNFNSVFCNGVQGGFTGTDEFCFVLFREKAEQDTGNQITITREKQVEIIMTMEGARMLTNWLNKQVKRNQAQAILN